MKTLDIQKFLWYCLVLERRHEAMSVLEDFYYGELNPYELCSKLDEELKNLMKLKSRNEENLVGTLTEKQKCDFEKFKDCEQEYSQISEKKSFLIGFKLGARIVIEAMI